MFFSKTADNSDLRMYLTLLNQLVKDGDNEYKELFNEIIKTSHELSTDQISYYQIKPELYEVVKVLTENNKPFFSNLNISEISQQTYQSIIQIFRSTINGSQNNISLAY